MKLTSLEKLVMDHIEKYKAPKGGWTRENMAGSLRRKGHGDLGWEARFVMDPLVDKGLLTRTRPGAAYRYFPVTAA